MASPKVVETAIVVLSWSHRRILSCLVSRRPFANDRPQAHNRKCDSIYSVDGTDRRLQKISVELILSLAERKLMWFYWKSVARKVFSTQMLHSFGDFDWMFVEARLSIKDNPDWLSIWFCGLCRLLTHGIWIRQQLGEIGLRPILHELCDSKSKVRF